MPSKQTRWHIAAAAGAAALGFVLAGAALVVMLLPNAAYIDTSYGKDIFFDCGMALNPRHVNDVEAARSCTSTIADMRQTAVRFAVAGGLLLLGSVAVLALQRRRRSAA